MPVNCFLFLPDCSLKAKVQDSLLLLQGIAKHLHQYNSEYLAPLLCKHSRLLLIDVLKFGDFWSTSSKSKHFLFSYVFVKLLFLSFATFFILLLFRLYSLDIIRINALQIN